MGKITLTNGELDKCIAELQSENEQEPEFSRIYEDNEHDITTQKYLAVDKQEIEKCKFYCKNKNSKPKNHTDCEIHYTACSDIPSCYFKQLLSQKKEVQKLKKRLNCPFLEKLCGVFCETSDCPENQIKTLEKVLNNQEVVYDAACNKTKEYYKQVEQLKKEIKELKEAGYCPVHKSCDEIDFDTLKAERDKYKAGLKAIVNKEYFLNSLSFEKHNKKDLYTELRLAIFKAKQALEIETKGGK